LYCIAKQAFFAAAGSEAFPSETDWKAHDKKRVLFSSNRKGVLNFLPAGRQVGSFSSS